MDAVLTAIVAASAAIISSALTSYITHRYTKRDRNLEYDLQWLDERFTGAISFLGSVLSAISAAQRTPNGRKKLAAKIHNIVDGPLRESNAWFIAVMLDPEDSGLRHYVFSTMMYAKIKESNEALTKYWAEVAKSLEGLANEYSKQRKILLSGMPLHALIQERKDKADREMRIGLDLAEHIDKYLNGQITLGKIIRKIGKSNIRGPLLEFMLSPHLEDPNNSDQLRSILIRKCTERAWIPK